MTARAEADVERLFDFLVVKNSRAALEATAAIRSTLSSLGELSSRGRPAARSGWRELLIPHGRDGYVVQYRVTLDEVVILRIFHGRDRRR